MVGVFTDRLSVYRLVGAILLESDEDWRAGRRYFSQENISKLLDLEVDEAHAENEILVDGLIHLVVLDHVNLHS